MSGQPRNRLVVTCFLPSTIRILALLYVLSTVLRISSSNLLNQKLAKRVTYTPSENKNIIWCKLDKTYFNFQKDIYLGTVYLTPPNYETNSSEDLMGELEEEMFSFSQKGDIIVPGDYNPRTGGIQETVLDDDNAFLNVREDYENDEQRFRRSQDSGTVNARGRNLLETCTALNLRILNGRIVGDLEDKKTCFHCNGSSVVDYVMGSKSILRNVRYLIVKSINATFIGSLSLIIRDKS